MGRQDWTREEVEAIVADYFHMLTLELSGQDYNKSQHRRTLQEKLRDRSEGSIEQKHQNISAVLQELSAPTISGYKGLPNYQQLLFDVVQERLIRDRAFDDSALAAAEQPAIAPLATPDLVVFDDAPSIEHAVRDMRAPDQSARKRVPIVRDYLAREANNRSLGLAGEKFIVEFEQRRLFSAGLKHLSEKVDHVAFSKGDGLGFDVLSFDLDGRERFIEVKTTSFGKQTPFYVSRGEVGFSQEKGEQFHLYRVFEFRRSPKVFDLMGAVGSNCLLDPVSYLARFS